MNINEHRPDTGGRCYCPACMPVVRPEVVSVPGVEFKTFGPCLTCANLRRKLAAALKVVEAARELKCKTTWNGKGDFVHQDGHDRLAAALREFEEESK